MRTSGLIMLAAVVTLLASCGQESDKPISEETATPSIEKSAPESPVVDKAPTGPEPTDQTSPTGEPETAAGPDAASAVEVGNPSQPAVPGSTSEPPTSNQAKLERSLQTWNELKAKCKGNYSYKIAWSSWVGFGHETELVVRDNKVTERRYREWSGQPVPLEPGKTSKPQGKTWTEQGEQLGSHKEGAPPKTLDQLYEEAAKILDEKLEPHHRLFVRFDDRGLLKSCFYVDTRIADDAPQTGVVINSIKLKSGEE